jgi:hypothetical protein
MQPEKTTWVGRTEYRLSNRYLHREDGPAWEWISGGKFYYFYDVIITNCGRGNWTIGNGFIYPLNVINYKNAFSLMHYMRVKHAI